MDQPRPLTAHFDRRFAGLWRGFWLVWVGIGLVLLALGLWFDLLALTIIGPVLIVVMGVMFLFTHRRLSDPRPVLQIGPDGYHDRRIGPPIPWAEVRRLVPHQPGNRVFLMLDVDDPARFMATSGAFTSLALRLNPKMGFPVLGSTLAGLDHPQDDILRVAQAYWQAAQLV